MADERFAPCFIPLRGDGTQHFAVWHEPAGDTRPLRLVVHIPPFAEELNKSRRMSAAQARMLASDGAAVLRFDLLGCGDSDGEFGDADWAAWAADVIAACQWACLRWAERWPAHPPGARWLWAHRAGALLLEPVLQALDASWDLLLWQPALQGKAVLQQFLRLEAAAALIAGTGKPAQRSARDRLRSGEKVCIAGYELAPGLASGVESARLALPPGNRRIEWLECSPRESDGPAPAVAAVLQALSAGGHAVRLHSVRGPQFWQTTEIEDAPELLVRTIEVMRDVPLLASRDSVAVEQR